MNSKSEKRSYPAKASEYKLLEEIGHGINAIVYRAICRPYESIVAVKCLDLEKCGCNLDGICQEAQLMSLLDHPNVMKAYCSFIVDHFLWIVMPYMDGGSCLHIMKVAAPDGFDESVIAAVLKETLKAIDYLHQQGHIHRDVKAGNILVDSNGAVKLGDFGVSACLFGGGGRQWSRNTIVGTPCWMAPEVMEQKYGYDIRADIWSFGITALELAHGHAPFSKYPPMKVLLMTIQNAPPGLDRERDQYFSKAFKEMLKMCLVKDPSKRPTAEKLLKHSFFKHVKAKDHKVQKLLHGLGPLWERESILREKDSARLAKNKSPYPEQEEKSRDEYIRGVSCWHFDAEDIKAQAALIPEDDGLPCGEDEGSVSRTNSGKDSDDTIVSIQSSSPSENAVKQQSNTLSHLIVNSREIGPGQWSSGMKGSKQVGRFDVFDGDLELESPGWHEIVSHRKHLEAQQREQKLDTILEDTGRHGMLHGGQQIQKSPSELLLVNQTSAALTSKPRTQEPTDPSTIKDCSGNEQFGVTTSDQQFARNNMGSSNPVPVGRDVLEEKGSSINRKGQCSVMLKAAQPTETTKLFKSASAGDFMSPQPSFSSALSSDGSIVPVSILVPQLKNFLLQIENQRRGVLGMLNAIDPNGSLNGDSVYPLSQSHSHQNTYKDADIHEVLEDYNIEQRIYELQSKVTNLTNELISTKLKNVQLEHQLNAIYNREEEERIQREEAEKENNL